LSTMDIGDTVRPCQRHHSLRSDREFGLRGDALVKSDALHRRSSGEINYGTEKAARSRRHSSGNTRHAHSAYAGSRTSSRTYDCASNRT